MYPTGWTSSSHVTMLGPSTSTIFFISHRSSRFLYNLFNMSSSFKFLSSHLFLQTQLFFISPTSSSKSPLGNLSLGKAAVFWWRRAYYYKPLLWNQSMFSGRHRTCSKPHHWGRNRLKRLNLFSHTTSKLPSCGEKSFDVNLFSHRTSKTLHVEKHSKHTQPNTAAATNSPTTRTWPVSVQIRPQQSTGIAQPLYGRMQQRGLMEHEEKPVSAAIWGHSSYLSKPQQCRKIWSIWTTQTGLGEHRPCGTMHNRITSRSSLSTSVALSPTLAHDNMN